MQEDHSMWMESLLFHTLPKPVGRFLEDYTMPLIGEHPALPTSPSGCQSVYSHRADPVLQVMLFRGVDVCDDCLHGRHE